MKTKGNVTCVRDTFVQGLRKSFRQADPESQKKCLAYFTKESAKDTLLTSINGAFENLMRKTISKLISKVFCARADSSMCIHF